VATQKFTTQSTPKHSTTIDGALGRHWVHDLSKTVAKVVGTKKSPAHRGDANVDDEAIVHDDLVDTGQPMPYRSSNDGQTSVDEIERRELRAFIRNPDGSIPDGYSVTGASHPGVVAYMASIVTDRPRTTPAHAAT
jgi:hypothetical protein